MKFGTNIFFVVPLIEENEDEMTIAKEWSQTPSFNGWTRVYKNYSIHLSLSHARQYGDNKILAALEMKVYKYEKEISVKDLIKGWTIGVPVRPGPPGTFLPENWVGTIEEALDLFQWLEESHINPKQGTALDVCGEK
jgi:hypothetical protein